MSALSDLMLAIKSPELTQKDIAEFYAKVISENGLDSDGWTAINIAIVDRWSLSGLKRVKRLAWSQQ